MPTTRNDGGPDLIGGEGRRPRPVRTLTEPQKAVYATPQPSEAAALLAAPEGWPDITDELAEIRFSAIQGFDDDTRRAVEALRERYPGHPEVDALVAEMEAESPDAPERIAGTAGSTVPPATPAMPLIPVDGPPPKGRFRTGTMRAAGSPSSELPAAIESSTRGGTLPPAIGPDESAVGLELPPLVAPAGSGAPIPTALETSDELLNLDAAGFDGLDDLEDDLDDERVDDPGFSSDPLSLIDQLDLGDSAPVQRGPTTEIPTHAPYPEPLSPAPLSTGPSTQIPTHAPFPDPAPSVPRGATEIPTHAPYPEPPSPALRNATAPSPVVPGPAEPHPASWQGPGMVTEVVDHDDDLSAPAMDLDGDDLEVVEVEDEDDDADEAPDASRLDGLDDFADLDALDLDEPLDDEEVEDEFDPVDRTLMVQGLQTPSPFAVSPGPTLRDFPAMPDDDDDDDDGPLSFDDLDDEDGPGDRRSTLAPDGDRRASNELETTLPPSGLVVRPNRSTVIPTEAPGAPSYVPRQPTPVSVPERRATLVPSDPISPPVPAPYAGPGGEPPIAGAMTTPGRDGEDAAASGEFRVADLDLDGMPDLEARSSTYPPIDDDIDLDFEDSEDDDGGLGSELAPEPEEQRTSDGTVVARAPMPPSPYGRGEAPLPVLPVRLVMLGPRGEAVVEIRIEAGNYFDVGRRPGTPWAEDLRMEPLHARLFPAPGGLVIDDFGAPNGVYTQITDVIAIEDGDEFKVGQARLALQRVAGRDGTWGQLTLVRHDDPRPRTFRLDRDEVILGREEGDITLPTDTYVSGDHCRFSREGNAVYLEDLGSSNGTYIRVRAGQCVALGGLILIGHTQFRVLAG